MPDVTQQLSLRFERIVDAIEHVVHRLGQLGDIVVPVHGEPFVQRLRCDPLRRLPHLAQRAQQTCRDDRTRGGDHDERDTGGP